MALLRRPVLSSRPAVLPFASLLLVGVLTTGCGGGDEEAAPSGSSSSAPAAPQVSADDYAAAIDDAEAVAQAGDDFQQAYDTYDQAIRAYLQGDLTDIGALTAVQGAAQPYLTAAAAYREAADSLYADPFVVDPEVTAARDAYVEQVDATVESHDAGVAVAFTYISCRQAQEISLLGVERHARLADACIETVEPLTGNAIPEVVAYAEGVTRLMKQRKRAYSSYDKEVSGLAAPEGDLLDLDRLDAAADQQGQVNAALERATRRSDAAYATFEPTLDAVLAEDGAGPALQARYDAASVDASQAALIAALQAGGGEG